ncbi:MAG TPA: hypothetical protein VMY16_04445 [Ilumatobacteraceae bacterium]|nr:hypothetical protein [Ilumatobacteraceae bacterium]
MVGPTRLPRWRRRLGGAGTRGTFGQWVDQFSEAAAFRDTMGDDAFAAAVKAGATLDPRATGELARQLLAEVRADHLAD